MNQELGPLLVEIYLEEAHILGVCRQVQERRRLIDVLNHQDETIQLEQAWVNFGRAESQPQSYQNLTVVKSAIIAAVPRETQEQTRRRAVLTNVVGRQETRQKELALIVPPLAISGSAHISAGAGALQSMSAFPKYFPLTNSRLAVPGQPERDLDVVIVSRDRVVAISMAPESRLNVAI